MTSKHYCHVIGCRAKISLGMLMCGRHWALVPKDIKKLVWDNYRPGQELDKNPSLKYLQAAKAAIASVEKMK